MNRSIKIATRASVAACVLALGSIVGMEPAAAAGDGHGPPGYSLAGTGGKDDFDWLAGAWTTRQRRLKARGVGSSEWTDSPANVHCATSYLDGGFTLEESYSPAKTVSGLFLYAFDKEKHQWSLYWIDPKSGKLDSPLVGGFAHGRGEFYGADVEDGRPIKVRYSWILQDRDHARWEQAYSFDDTTWEINWTSEFTRVDAASVCTSQGRPHG